MSKRSNIHLHLIRLLWLLLVGGSLINTICGSESGEHQNFSNPQFETTKIGSSPGIIGANFGAVVALDGETAIFTAPLEQTGSTPNTSKGAVYIFVRSEGIWIQQARLTMPSETTASFAVSAAISGDTVIIGSNSENFPGNRGAAFIYVRNAGIWTLEQKLFLSSPVVDSFGQSVAITGNTVVVGAPSQSVSNAIKGAAYIFVRNGTVWTQINELTDPNGNAGDQFGGSTAIDDQTILIGAIRGDATGSNSNEGTVSVFTRVSNSWIYQTRLNAADGLGGGAFGVSIDVEANTAIIGAGGGNGAVGGSAYIFSRTGSDWTQLQELSAVNTSHFGNSVGLSGNTAIVGASFERVGTNFTQGAAYVYSRNGNVWTQHLGRLLASDGDADDRFGSGVAVNGNRLLVGAPFNDGAGSFHQGAAYFFIKPPGAPDLQSASDSGISDTDNITKLHSITFDVAGVTDGATVELLRNGAVIDSAVGGSSITLADTDAPADGIYHYATRQIVNGEVSSVSEETLITFDNTPPVIAVTQHQFQSDPTANNSVYYRIDVSEPVNGLDSSDISFNGSTADLSAVTITLTQQEPLLYAFTVNNVVANNQTVVAGIPANAVSDAAGNLNLNFITNDNTVTVDNVGASVTINQAVNQIDPTANLPINFTVVFSEPVSDFDSASDISFSGSTANTFGATVSITGSGTTYNVTIGGIISNGQIVRVAVPYGAAHDWLNNPNSNSTATDNTVTIDNVRPSVTINQAFGQTDPTAMMPVNFTVVFNEAVTNFDATDVSLAGSTANVSAANIVVTGSGANYRVAISNILSSGQIRASLPANVASDALGNLSNASTSTDNVVTINVRRAQFDFDGDGRADVSVFRPDNGAWYLQQSSAGFTGITFGFGTDKLVPADYDGDGKTDVAVYRNGTWYLQRSSLGFYGVAFGDANDIPVPADYDGDGRADIAVFRPSNGTWYLQQSTAGFTGVAFGQNGDKPVAADYDGDGKADIAVNRAGTWYINRSQLGFYGVAFGDGNDKLVPADYDGDGKADIAVFRPSNGVWYLQQSTAGFTGIAFGLGTDIPAAADYDGDGRADLGVVRNGTWYLNRTTQGFTGIAFGTATDKPIPNAFVR